MSNSIGLIAGLAGFMEDTDVSVEVSVTEPEEIEQSEEAVEAGAEIAEVSEEAESTDEQAEMILMHFAELEHRYNHVRQHGVDRTFMRLFNSKDELSRACGRSFPSCESFDATGSASSAESIACMEGLGDALSKVWEFIKSLCRKIASFFSRLFEAVRVRLGDLNKQIGRLRKLNQERTSDVDGIADADKKVVSLPGFEKIQKAVLDRIQIKKGVISFQKAPAAVADLTQLVKDLEKAPSDEAKLKQYNDGLADYKKEFNTFKSDMRKLFDSPDTIEIGKMSAADISTFLTSASNLMSSLDSLKNFESMTKTNLQNVERFAANKSARAANPNEAKADRLRASAMSRSLNLMSGQASFAAEIYQKLASMAVRSASTRLQYRKKTA